jgi:hypothetical protein
MVQKITFKSNFQDASPEGGPCCHFALSSGDFHIFTLISTCSRFRCYFLILCDIISECFYYFLLHF